MPDPVVSPADTIRRLRFSRVPCPEPGCTGSFPAVKVHADNRGVTAPCPGCRGRGSVPDPAFDDALDAALLAVGERHGQQIARLTEALREVEWRGSAWIGMECCPMCGHERGAGHRFDCTLDAVLAGEEDAG